MKTPLRIINRTTGQIEEEKIFGEKILRFLYGNSFGKNINTLIASIPLFSKLYGWWQKQPWTKKNILPFISTYEVDSSEFLEPLAHFKSFNDFFIRKLKPTVRPIAQNKDPSEEIAIIPADARALFFSNFSKTKEIFIKGKCFSLEKLLGSSLAKQYANGSLALFRLCPTDYHRFHFPVDCTPQESKLIKGTLFSVNPMALKQNIEILTNNKRSLCPLENTPFGRVLFIEIGATCVGSIHQTYTPYRSYKKGDEKGYFSFGGSSLVLLFEPGTIEFDKDLLDATEKGLEIRCLMGQRLGKKLTLSHLA